MRVELKYLCGHIADLEIYGSLDLTRIQMEHAERFPCEFCQVEEQQNKEHYLITFKEN